jgi:hypothetical protein
VHELARRLVRVSAAAGAPAAAHTRASHPGGSGRSSAEGSGAGVVKVSRGELPHLCRGERPLKYGAAGGGYSLEVEQTRRALLQFDE